jgi:hypothetical protein
MYGQHPVTLNDALTRSLPNANDSILEPPAVNKLIEGTGQATALSQPSIKRANDRMTANVNKSRRDIQFQVGDLVLLSTANLRLPLGTKRVKKLAPKFIGPFSILERIAEGRAYRLELPPHMRLHPTFHVWSLRSFYPDSNPGRTQPNPTQTTLLMGTRNGKSAKFWIIGGFITSYNISYPGLASQSAKTRGSLKVP